MRNENFINEMKKVMHNASLNWDADGIRTHDLTESTDDPGNTELYIFFVPAGDYDDNEIHEGDLQGLIQHKLTKGLIEGDHFDEVIVTSQNNEFLVIVNRNK